MNKKACIGVDLDGTLAQDRKGNGLKKYRLSPCIEIERYISKIARAIWISHFGSIPKGEKRLCVCHRCDNKLCINIEHLFLGTYEQNSNDMACKGRAAKQKLDPKARQNIILSLLDNRCSMASLARKYGVSRQRIQQIKRKLSLYA